MISECLIQNKLSSQLLCMAIRIESHALKHIQTKHSMHVHQPSQFIANSYNEVYGRSCPAYPNILPFYIVRNYNFS